MRYIFRTAYYDFKCPITGKLVKKGDLYVLAENELKISLDGFNQIRAENTKTY